MDENAHAAQGASTLRHYVEVARRRKLIIIWAALLACAASLGLSFLQKPVYGATSEILISRQDLSLSLTDTADPAAAQPEREIETQVQLARIPEVAQRTLKRARLTDRTPGQFIASSSVSARKNSDLIRVQVNDVVPAIAVRLANAYAREFTIYRREIDTAPFALARREVASRIAQLERQGRRDSELYASLIDKDQELRTIEALRTSNAFVVKEATKAGKISPKPLKSGVLGLMLGLVLGTGLAFLWEALDTRVRSTEEIARELGLPLLGRLPGPPAALQNGNQLVMLEQPNSVQGEAFRILRTNLDFFNLDQGARTVMVTSAVGQEGKSTTSANLAIALARAGQNVALVDLDLRRPRLHTLFDLPRAPGVTEVILGRAKIEPQQVDSGETTLQAEQGSLQVLPAGEHPPHVGELIGASALGDIIDELKERVDIVLIDTAPLLLVGDTMALSSRVDAVIVVTRLNVVRRPLLRELRRVLAVCPAGKLGFVVTGAELEDDYRYGYGGYYAYGQQSAKEARRA